MSEKVLYLGDTALCCQAAYLAGIMSYYNIKFDYLSSDDKFNNKLLSQNYSLMILSDYSSSNFEASQIIRLIDKINNHLNKFSLIGSLILNELLYKVPFPSMSMYLLKISGS